LAVCCWGWWYKLLVRLKRAGSPRCEPARSGHNGQTYRSNTRLRAAPDIEIQQTIPHSRSHAIAPDALHSPIQQDCAYDQSITDAFFIAAIFCHQTRARGPRGQALDDCRAAVEARWRKGRRTPGKISASRWPKWTTCWGVFFPGQPPELGQKQPGAARSLRATLPLLSEYSTWVGQHEGLYKAYRDLRDGDHYATLNTAQKKAVDNAA
jgi:hypothetical protein